MTAEIHNNEISMDMTTEQGVQNPPPEYAVRQLAKQLDVEHLDTAVSAAGAIQRASLNSDDPLVRIDGIRMLGEFASLHPNRVDAGKQESLRVAQSHARDKIAAIAFGSEQAEVRLAAVMELGRSLFIPALSSERHDNTIQLIAIIGATAPDNNVKNEAIAALSGYASIRRNQIYGGYEGKSAYPESQQYANAAIGVVSKPTPETAPAPAPTPEASPTIIR